MKTYYVYEIKEDSGKTIDVGQTYHPEVRLYEHTKKKNGRHYKREDINMVIVQEFNTRKEALKLEAFLKLQYDLELTEQNWQDTKHKSNNGKISWEKNKDQKLKDLKVGRDKANASATHPNKLKVTCEHCGKTMSKLTAGRYHGAKCKNKQTI